MSTNPKPETALEAAQRNLARAIEARDKALEEVRAAHIALTRAKRKAQEGS